MRKTEAQIRADIRKQREVVYGNTYMNMRQIGIAITALIEAHYQIILPHPVPPHVAAHIMAGPVKQVRAVAPNGLRKDTYRDGVNFWEIAYECHERDSKAKDSNDRVQQRSGKNNKRKSAKAGS
jgi:hypothetical protein